MTYYDYTPTVHFRVIWQKNEENIKYRVFYEDSEFMRILDFQSDVWFRRNDGFKIARHFESLALLCERGFLSLVLYCSAMYAGGHVVCVK